ncbi:hypothetical protein BD414DRAFT_435578 [Trametes punicea]|nr:hypothetical protein BD414DRAFT_435578 [Trametes punicea]
MNGIDPRSTRSERPTERTPLLPSRRSTQRAQVVDSDTDGLPYIGTSAASLSLEDISTYRVDNLSPRSLSSRGARTAFALCVLLYYRKSIAEGSTSPRRDVWTRWHEKEQSVAAIRDLDALTARVWADFLVEEGAQEEIAEVLWSAYPVDTYSTLSVRVIDFLAVRNAPKELLCHPLIYLSLMDTWNYGPADARGDESIAATLLRFLDRCGTPCVLHIIDFLAHSIYLCMLYHYLTWPPYLEPIRTFDTRRTFVMIYTLSRLANPWSSSCIPRVLVLTSFLSCLPYVPMPNSFTFSVLLFSFCWEIILLHLPGLQPSPLLFLPADWILPLAVLARRSLVKLLAPTVYFLPGLVACLFMLQLSLIPSLSTFALYSLYPVPMDARVTYFSLLTTFLLFLCCSFVYSLLVHPFLATLEGPKASIWDRYTQSVGLEARQSFMRAAITYGTPYYFPRPLNLGQVLLVQIPRFFLVSNWRDSSAKTLALLDSVLWRITVGPAAFVLSGFWLWNLRPDS